MKPKRKIRIKTLNFLASQVRKFPFMKYPAGWLLYTLTGTDRRNRVEEIIETFAADESESEKQYIRHDLIYCREAFNIKYNEYFLFNLRHKSFRERNAFVFNLNRSKYLCLLGTKEGHMILRDKYKTYTLLRKYYKRDVEMIASSDDFNKFEDFLAKHFVFVKKPQDNSFGKGVELMNLADFKSAEELFEKLADEMPYLMEEEIIADEKMASLHPSSINTVRVPTFLDPDGQVHVHLPFIKIGKDGSFVDNGGSGGMFALIDAETGILIADGKDEMNNRYVVHPNTGVKIKGFQIPGWDEAKELAKAAARDFTETRYIGWDLALSADRGWVVVEGNGRTEFYGQQMTDEIGKRESLEKLINYKQLIKDNPDYEIWDY